MLWSAMYCVGAMRGKLQVARAWPLLDLVRPHPERWPGACAAAGAPPPGRDFNSLCLHACSRACCTLTEFLA